MSPKFAPKRRRSESEIHRSPEAAHNKANTSAFEVPTGILNIQRHIGNSGVKRMLSNAPAVERSMIQRSKDEIIEGGLVDPFGNQSQSSAKSIEQGGLVDPFGNQSQSSAKSIEQGGLVDPFMNKSPSGGQSSKFEEQSNSVIQGGLVDPFFDKGK